MRSFQPVRAVLSRLLVLALASAGGTTAEDAFPLRRVEFEGNATFTDEDLIPVTGLQLGEPARKADFDLALRKLNETGVFESLRYRFGPFGDGYMLTIGVQEVADLFPVRFEGFDTPVETIKAWLQKRLPMFLGLVPSGGPMVRTVVSNLQAWWREQGGAGNVVADIVPVSGGRFEMVVGPERQTSNIAFTKFHDAGDVDYMDLQRIFNQAAVGEPYSEARLRELLHYNARPLYTERGYMDVTFCPCQTRPDPDSEGLLVDVQVRQGDVYLFGEIAWPEPMPIDDDSLRKVNRIDSGLVANIKAAYETMAAISEGMKRQGYMKAQATFDERIDHEERLVHLDIQIALGTQYRFSRLLISGLDILSEPAVRERWGMAAGDPFDVRYPAYFLERIKADAMFENLRRTSWRLETDDRRGLVDVSLEFYGMADEE